MVTNFCTRIREGISVILGSFLCTWGRKIPLHLATQYLRIFLILEFCVYIAQKEKDMKYFYLHIRGGISVQKKNDFSPVAK